MGVRNYFKGWFNDIFYKGTDDRKGPVRGTLTAPATKFAIKAAIELSVIEYLRLQVDPFAQLAGKKIDDTFELLDDLRSNVDKTEKLIDKAKEKTEDIAEKAFKWIKKKITGDAEETKKALRKAREGTTQQVVSETEHVTRTVVEHPTWIPHYDTNEPYRFIFSDVTNLLFLAVFGVFVAVNFRTLIFQVAKKRKERTIDEKMDRKIKRLLEERLLPLINASVKPRFDNMIVRQNQLQRSIIETIRSVNATTDRIGVILKILSRLDQGQDQTDSEEMRELQALLAKYDDDVLQAKQLAERVENETRLAITDIGRAAHDLEPVAKDIVKAEDWQF